jgi:hypothetical protein
MLLHVREAMGGEEQKGQKGVSEARRALANKRHGNVDKRP